MSNLEIVRRYFDAIEQRASVDELAGHFHPDVVQEEFPNRLVPEGARRGLDALREASARGRQVVSSERYEILNSISEGSQIALEVQWTATMNVAIGNLKAGEPMKARFGVFIELENGKIKRQGNYDCFDPF